MSESDTSREVSVLEVKYKKQGELFLAARKKSKLRQIDVAKICGIDRSTLSYIETGKTYPSLELLKKLIVIYKTTPNQILEMDSVKNII